MTDPYNERIDAMKRLERGSSVFVNIMAECQDPAQATRNAERLAAYHEKRQASADRFMRWLYVGQSGG